MHLVQLDVRLGTHRHLVEGNKRRIVVQKLAASSKHWIIEALKRFIAVDNARTLVTMGEPAKYREVQPIVLPNFDKVTHPRASVTEGDNVLTLRLDELGAQKLFVDTSKAPAGQWRPPLVEEDWVVPCQALYQAIGGWEWRDLHQKL